jgi:hypothetical protein
LFSAQFSFLSYFFAQENQYYGLKPFLANSASSPLFLTVDTTPPPKKKKERNLSVCFPRDLNLHSDGISSK